MLPPSAVMPPSSPEASPIAGPEDAFKERLRATAPYLNAEMVPDEAGGGQLPHPASMSAGGGAAAPGPTPPVRTEHAEAGHSRWKDALKGFLRGLGTQHQPSGDFRMDFFRQLGGGLGGGAAGLIHPQAIHELEYGEQMDAYRAQEDRALEQREREQRIAGSKATSEDQAARRKADEDDRGHRRREFQEELAAKEFERSRDLGVAVGESVRGTSLERFLGQVPTPKAAKETGPKAARWFEDPVTGEIKFGSVDADGNPVVQTTGEKLNVKPPSEAGQRAEINRAYSMAHQHDTQLKPAYQKALSQVEFWQTISNQLESSAATGANFVVPRTGDPELDAQLAEFDSSGASAAQKLANARARLKGAQESARAAKDAIVAHLKQMQQRFKGGVSVGGLGEGEWSSVTVDEAGFGDLDRLYNKGVR